MDAMHVARKNEIECDENAWRLEQHLMEHLEKSWQQPDEGIWEVRGPRRHFVHSKVMAWVAADRAVRTLEEDPALEGDLEGWRAMRDEVHREVCERGFDPARNTFTQSYGSRELDA